MLARTGHGGQHGQLVVRSVRNKGYPHLACRRAIVHSRIVFTSAASIAPVNFCTLACASMTG